MSDLFSTELIPAPDRLAAWRSYASLVCGNSQFEFPRQSAFRGAIDRRSVGPLQLSHFSSTPVSFAKYPTVNSKSDDPGCVIISQLRGEQEYRQKGNKVTLRPSDSTLIDAGQPWFSTCASLGSRLYLRFPRWLVQEKISISDLPALPRVSGTSGLGATLFGLASSLYHEAGLFTHEEGMAAIEAYLRILAACLGRRQRDQLPHVPEIGVRIEQFIEANLSDSGLTPAQVAAQAGISVRHLHRLFLRKGETVRECIQRKRLENCRSELADPRFLQRSITEVAFAWGFSDSAHFSHSFKRHFGVSPREFRLQLLNRHIPSGDCAPVKWPLKDAPGCPN